MLLTLGHERLVAIDAVEALFGAYGRYEALARNGGERVRDHVAANRAALDQFGDQASARERSSHQLANACAPMLPPGDDDADALPGERRPSLTAAPRAPGAAGLGDQLAALE